MARRVTVMVKPNAQRSACVTLPDGSLVVRLAAPPVDGRANAELVVLLAAHFGVPKSRVRIARGAGARVKQVEIDD